MSEGTDFETALAALCAKEISVARHDPERMANMLERLCHNLGHTIAHASDGQADHVDQFMQGVEGYIYSAAVTASPLARFMAQLGGKK